MDVENTSTSRDLYHFSFSKHYITGLNDPPHTHITFTNLYFLLNPQNPNSTTHQTTIVKDCSLCKTFTVPGVQVKPVRSFLFR